MKPTRRTFLTGTTLAALSSSATAKDAVTAAAKQPLVLSPPVIQNPTATSFTVVWRVSQLASGEVQWRQGDGEWTAVRPAHHGLVRAEDRTIAVRISGVKPKLAVTYRTVTTPIIYHNAYKLERGTSVTGAERTLRLPDADATTFRLGMVNDTHENKGTLAWLSQQIEKDNSDLLMWNGDTCNDFYDPVRLAEICLDNGQSAEDPAKGGWAATRPLLFVPGNHDVRGPHAHSLATALTPWMPGAHPVSGPSATA